MTVRVKICGITRPLDARAAADAGASAIGLVFWPRSPRSVTSGRASEIAHAVAGTGTVTVGVFVNQPARLVASIVRAVPLDAVQLHGEEDPADYDFGVPILKAFPADGSWDPAILRRVGANVLPLLDARDDARRGGTGKTVDLPRAARAAAERAIVLAGGLTPLNVGEAVRAVRPFGVDVSSGVESAPGVKDAARVRAFCDAVRQAAGAIPRGLER